MTIVTIFIPHWGMFGMFTSRFSRMDEGTTAGFLLFSGDIYCGFLHASRWRWCRWTCLTKELYKKHGIFMDIYGDIMGK